MSTIKQILNEEKLKPSKGRRIGNRIYSDIDQITRKIGNFIQSETKDKEGSRILSIDVTNIIPDKYNDYNKKIVVKLSNSSKTKKKIQNHVISAGKIIQVILSWPDTFDSFWTSQRNAFAILKHELVHVLDYLEMTDEEISNDNKNVSPNFLTSSVSYYSDLHEFNQIINNLHEYSRLFPNSWKKINSFDKIYDIIDKHGNGMVKVDSLLRNHDIFRAKLKKRLKKDGLLPPLMNILN